MKTSAALTCLRVFFFFFRQFESWKGDYISGNKRMAPMVGAGDVRVSLHVCGVLTSGSHMWF